MKSLVTTVLIMLGATQVAQAQYPYRSYGYGYGYAEYTYTTHHRVWIDTWHPGRLDAFDYGGIRWTLLETTTCITPGYVCRAGYLRFVKRWYDADLGYSYVMCPCGRVFYTRTYYGW